MLVTRRNLIVGLGAGLICAPAIVRVTSIMPVKVFETGSTLPGGMMTVRTGLPQGIWRLFYQGIEIKYDEEFLKSI